MKSLFVKKSFAFLVFFASQFFCFAAGKNVKQLVPMEVTPVEYRNIYLNWNNEGTPQFFSYEDLQNDVNALNYLISTAYAGYEDAVERGLNLETFAEQVDDYYYSYDRISTDDYIHTLTNCMNNFLILFVHQNATPKFHLQINSYPYIFHKIYGCFVRQMLVQDLVQ